MHDLFVLSRSYFRQLSGLKVEYAHMNGFQSHIQNEQKENMIREESRLHIYSSNDVDMYVYKCKRFYRFPLFSPYLQHGLN